MRRATGHQASEHRAWLATASWLSCSTYRVRAGTAGEKNLPPTDCMRRVSKRGQVLWQQAVRQVEAEGGALKKWHVNASVDDVAPREDGRSRGTADLARDYRRNWPFRK
eukprot:scaffold53275_cov32-Tisochrysis_lutea.AAC.4